MLQQGLRVLTRRKRSWVMHSILNGRSWVMHIKIKIEKKRGVGCNEERENGGQNESVNKQTKNIQTPYRMLMIHKKKGVPCPTQSLLHISGDLFVS